MIRSASVMASATADSNAGDGLPSQWISFRAASMLAAINNARLRPSSTSQSLAFSPCIRPDGLLPLSQIFHSGSQRVTDFTGGGHVIFG